MPLTDLILDTAYEKSNCNVADEFYTPCMKRSIKYDRLSGFFSSTIYLVIWDALQEFINNGGKIRLVCSPELSPEDKIELRIGNASKTDEIISRSLAESFDKMMNKAETLNPAKLLACLISKDILEIKLAILYDSSSIYHDKVGIFMDSEGNTVGFRGAMNETYKGLAEDGNIESVEVFASWDGKKDAQRTARAQRAFDEIWYGKVEDVRVYNLPESIRYKFLDVSEKEKISDLLPKVVSKKKEETSGANTIEDKRELRPHQKAVLLDWESKNRRGIVEHATGSGKTFTAITAIRRSLEKNDEIILVLVPSSDLLKQWQNELRTELHDLSPSPLILTCDSKTSLNWEKMLNRFSKKTSEEHKIIISTIQTASCEKFLSKLSNGHHIFLVADEVHRYGSMQFKQVFLRINAGARLGLSATPQRYGDPEGTATIYNYFENSLSPKYSLYDAIRDGVLTKYEYNPYEVELTAEEQENWKKISKDIKKKYAAAKNTSKNTDSIWNNPSLKSLLIRRSRILKAAQNKIPIAVKILHKYTYGDKWIVYCDSIDQIKELYHELNEDPFFENIMIMHYHSNLADGERRKALQTFKDNSGIMLSVKCLDEGIDIPSVTHALIIASSKNPREFIQRRGRILRKSPGKIRAYLYDLLVVPLDSDNEEDMTISIVKSELKRAIEFGENAINFANCTVNLMRIALEHNVNLTDISDGGYDDDDEDI